MLYNLSNYLSTKQKRSDEKWRTTGNQKATEKHQKGRQKIKGMKRDLIKSFKRTKFVHEFVHTVVYREMEFVLPTK